MRKIKILIVDDSAYSRQALIRALSHSNSIEIVGTARDGEEGLKKALNLSPDIVLLDLQMPVLDGFGFLKILMKKKPLPVIVVTSLRSKRDAIRALEFGAVDFILKPSPLVNVDYDNFRYELLNKIYSLTGIRKSRLSPFSKSTQLSELEDIEFHRNEQPVRIKIVAIGASTGGPLAIQYILKNLPSQFPASIIISQHMPPLFTRAFAERLNEISPLSVKEAEDGEPVVEGKVLISPGGFHTLVEKGVNGVKVRIIRGREEDRYIPSIDIMMKSCAEVFGPKTLGIILTGMGSDGKEGIKKIKEVKGQTIAEAKESCVVFGMPREAVETGAVDKVVPLEKIPQEILKRVI